MQISLFSQSLFGLPIEQAIQTTRVAGYQAIELACGKPHFDLDLARQDSSRIVALIEAAGLKVSALSLFNSFTDPGTLTEQIQAAEVFIRLAPKFKTGVVKLTPGQPGSAQATEAHWQCLGQALAALAPVAAACGVRLAFETHMRQLSDTLASTRRLLALAPDATIGLTVDFSNLAFAGEKMGEVIPALKDRLYNTHIKNGYIDRQGGWNFTPLDQGLTDYALVLRLLRDGNYNGYLTIECLGPRAETEPELTARTDLEMLRRRLSQVGWPTSG